MQTVGRAGPVSKVTVDNSRHRPKWRSLNIGCGGGSGALESGAVIALCARVGVFASSAMIRCCRAGAPTVPRDRVTNSAHQRGLVVRESGRGWRASERAPLSGVTPPSVPPGGVYLLKLRRAQSVSWSLEYRQIRRYGERSHTRGPVASSERRRFPR